MAELHHILCMLPVPWLGPPNSVAIRYVLPVLPMTSCFHTMGPMGRMKQVVMFRSSPGGGTIAVRRQATTVFVEFIRMWYRDEVCYLCSFSSFCGSNPNHCLAWEIVIAVFRVGIAGIGEVQSPVIVMCHDPQGHFTVGTTIPWGFKGWQEPRMKFYERSSGGWRLYKTFGYM